MGGSVNRSIGKHLSQALSLLVEEMGIKKHYFKNAKTLKYDNRDTYK